jgi:hypothetical protein
MKKTIQYPIFIQFLAFINDPFWRFIYEDMAYGRCPYGLYLQKNYLCSSIKNKEFIYKFEENKTIEEVYSDINSLLKEKVGLLSEKERIIQKESINRYKCKKDEWNHLKKKIIRETLLEQFVLQKSIQYQLSVGVIHKMLCLLIIGLIFKTINSKDIIYNNGIIENVNGFVFYPKKVLITKNILVHKVPKNMEETYNSKKLLYTYWSIYLNDIVTLVK